MDIEKLEKNHEEAKSLILKLKSKASDKEADTLFGWILNRDINLYSLFVQEGIASGSSSIEGLAGIYYDLHHALHDDGAISFVSVYDEPKIVMLHPSDFEDEESFFDLVKEMDLKGRSRQLQKPSYRLLDLSVSDFITMRDDFDRNHQKRCFLMDAGRWGEEFAAKHHKDKDFFDHAWVEESKTSNPYRKRNRDIGVF